MSRSRKHGVFAVSDDVVLMRTKVEVSKRDGMAIEAALDTVIQQMRIAGNRQHIIFIIRQKITYYLMYLWYS